MRAESSLVRIASRLQQTARTIVHSPDVNRTLSDGARESKRDKMQAQTPYAYALALLKQREWFCLPAHHGGNIRHELGDIDDASGTLKQLVLSSDVTKFDRAATEDLKIARHLANAKAGKLYGGVAALLTTGGSHANRIALNTILTGPACRNEFTVVVAGNSHLSIINALATIPNAMPRRLKIRFNTYGAMLPPRPEDVAAALQRYPNIAAIVLTFPTIGGLSSDISQISAIIKEHNRLNKSNVRLHVDQAWAPHSRNSEVAGLPKSPLFYGADSTSASLHKHADKALGQTAVVAVRHDDPRLIAHFESVYERESTTSPSSLMLWSADLATADTAAQHGRKMQQISSALIGLRRRLQGIPGLHFLNDDPEVIAGGYIVDPTKLTFRVDGVAPKALRELLDAHDFHTLLSDGDYASFHFTKPPAPAMLDAIITGIKTALRSLPPPGERPPHVHLADIPVHKLFPETPRHITPFDAYKFHDTVMVTLDEAVGRYCADYVSPLPPGIPVIDLGGKFTPAVIKAIKRWRALGYHMQGLENGKVRVLDRVPDRI